MFEFDETFHVSTNTNHMTCREMGNKLCFHKYTYSALSSRDSVDWHIGVSEV